MGARRCSGEEQQVGSEAVQKGSAPGYSEREDGEAAGGCGDAESGGVWVRGDAEREGEERRRAAAWERGGAEVFSGYPEREDGEAAGGCADAKRDGVWVRGDAERESEEVAEDTDREVAAGTDLAQQ